MEPFSITGLITAALPVATAGVKKLFKTDTIKSKNLKKGVNQLIPLALGVLSAGLYAYSIGATWPLAVSIGLGSGAVGGSMRDLGKRLSKIKEIIKDYS